MTATAPSVSLIRSQAQEPDLASLESLAQRTASGLQALLDVSNNGTVRITAGAANAVRYPEWRIAQNPFGALLRYRCANRNDELLVHLPGNFVSQIVDMQYGGSGVTPVRSAFSATELRFISGFGEQFAKLLKASGSRGTAHADFVEVHTDLLCAHWPKSRDDIVIQAIFAESENIKPTAITLVMASETLQLLVDGSNHDSASAMTVDTMWAERMRAAAMQLRVPARAILMRNQLSVQRLLTLSPGDVLPLLLPSQIPLIVEGRVLAHGSLGEANGRAALRIEKIEKEKDHE